MKKTHGILTLIFAAITLVSVVLNLILTGDPTLIAYVVAAILALSAAGMWCIPTWMKSKSLTLIPVLALLAISDYIKTLLTTLLSQISAESLGVLPTYFKFETLGFMLTAAFIVAAVLVFRKGYKWAVTASVVYSSIMLVCQVQLFLTYAMAASAFQDNETTAALMLMALAFVTAYATQVTMFLGVETESREPTSTEPVPTESTDDNDTLPD